MRASRQFVGHLFGAVSQALHCLFAFGHVCRFVPSCSGYAKEAVECHGLFRGSFMALSRIVRCNPFGAHGFDPVPHRKRCI